MPSGLRRGLRLWKVRTADLADSGGSALPIAGQALGKIVEAGRAANDETLRDLAFHCDQHVEDVATLNSLCHHRPAERMGKRNGRLDHDQVAAMVAHRFDEALVDLDLARR